MFFSIQQLRSSRRPGRGACWHMAHARPRFSATRAVLWCLLASAVAHQAVPAAAHPQEQPSEPADPAAAAPAPAPAKRTLPPIPSTGSSSPGNPGPLRVWIDDFFFAEGETVLLREAVAAAGNESAVLAGVTRNRVFQLKSYQQTSKADVLWTGRVGCYEAFKRHLNATHAVSCVPGTQAVSGKARLIASLEAAYGEAAWGLVPRSFRLPWQYNEMAAHLKQEQRSGRGGGLWVLKEDVHRGKGVGVVTPVQALARALERAPGGERRHVLAQQFLGEQLLVNGRPFYIRLWVVLMGSDPARAYLYDGGVVVFGQQQRTGQSADALIVNLWTQDRAAAAPWSLGQLEAHLAQQAQQAQQVHGMPGGASEASSQAPHHRLRARLHASVAASLAAGLPSVRRAAAVLPGFQGGSFEVLGVDFLVDASLRPWLVEVNFLPSMARKLVGCAGGGSASGADGGNDGSGKDSAGDGAASGGSMGDSAAVGGSADGSSSDSSSAGDSSSSGSGCQQDNPFDVQKEGFMRSLLGLMTDRHRQVPVLQQQADRVLQQASDAAAEGEAAPCLRAAQLRQLLALQGEQAAAERLGFLPLTDLMYRCLACMAAPQPGIYSTGGSTGSSTTTNSSSSSGCAPLADLAPPEAAPAGQQQGQGQQQLMARLRHWADRLQLEAASLVPWVTNPKARRQASAPAYPAGPYTLPASDLRMLAWMEAGRPQLGSVQGVRDFCGAAADGAPAEEEVEEQEAAAVEEVEEGEQQDEQSRVEL